MKKECKACEQPNVHMVEVKHPDAITNRVFFVVSKELNRRDLTAILKNYLFSDKYEIVVNGASMKQAANYGESSLTLSIGEAKRFVGTIRLYRTVQQITQRLGKPIKFTLLDVHHAEKWKNEFYDDVLRTFIVFKTTNPLTKIDDEGIVKHFKDRGINIRKTSSNRAFFVEGNLKAANTAIGCDIEYQPMEDVITETDKLIC